MPHIPRSGTAEIGVLTFEDALVPSENAAPYDRDRWIYFPDFYS